MGKERKVVDLEFIVMDRNGMRIQFSEPVSELLWQVPGAYAMKTDPYSVFVINNWDWKLWLTLAFKYYAKNPNDHMYNLGYAKHFFYTKKYMRNSEKLKKKKRTNQQRKSVSSSFSEIPKSILILGFLE